MARRRFPPWSVKERTLAKELFRLVRMKDAKNIREV